METEDTPVTGTLGDDGAPAKEKEALTLEQQEKLLKFVEQSNVYKPHLPMMQESEIFL